FRRVLFRSEDSSLKAGLRIFDRPTAYMPPLYPYYLLVIKQLFGFTDWIKVSIVIQCILYYFSVFYLFKTLLNKTMAKLWIFILFAFVVFFPPIFIGNIAVSSFALSVSILSVFFALLYKVFHARNELLRDLLYLSGVSLAGLYVRYEFIYILILSATVFIALRRIRMINFMMILLLASISYLPWAVRNYNTIGKFSYATSLNYNFAKGYNEKYNIF